MVRMSDMNFLGEESVLLCFVEEVLLCVYVFTPGQADVLGPAVNLLLGDQGMLPS